MTYDAINEDAKKRTPESYHPSIYPDLPKPWKPGASDQAAALETQALLEERAQGSQSFTQRFFVRGQPLALH